MYCQKVLDIFYAPKNVGIVQSASGIGIFEDENTHEIFKLYVKIENETIVDASFKVYSGVLGIATMSVLTEILKNKSLEEAQKLTEKDLLARLEEVDREQFYILTDAIGSIALAFEDYNKKLEKAQEKAKKKKWCMKNEQLRNLPCCASFKWYLRCFTSQYNMFCHAEQNFNFAWHLNNWTSPCLSFKILKVCDGRFF